MTDPKSPKLPFSAEKSSSQRAYITSDDMKLYRRTAAFSFTSTSPKKAEKDTQRNGNISDISNIPHEEDVEITRSALIHTIESPSTLCSANFPTPHHKHAHEVHRCSVSSEIVSLSSRPCHSGSKGEPIYLEEPQDDSERCCAATSRIPPKPTSSICSGVGMCISSSSFTCLHDFSPKVVHRSQTEPRLHNPFIYGGYRANHDTISTCVHSLFHMHNETCNVWSHLIGFFLFFFLGFYHYFETMETLSPLAFASVVFFYVCACISMLCSSAYHLLSCADEKTRLLSYQFDMAGIGMMTMGCFLPGVVLAFACDPSLMVFYSVFSITVVGAMIITQFIPACLHSKWYVARVSLVILTGCSCLVPVSHFFFTAPSEHISIFIPLVLRTCGCFFAGLIFWLTKIPEAWFPGSFDLFSSHCIWHGMVLLAALAWDRALLEIRISQADGSWIC